MTVSLKTAVSFHLLDRPMVVVLCVWGTREKHVLGGGGRGPENILIPTDRSIQVRRYRRGF